MSASKIKYGDPVVVLDVSNGVLGRQVIARTGHIGSTSNVTQATVRGEGNYEKTMQLSDPRLLTQDEAKRLRDASEASQWFHDFYPPHVAATIALQLSKTNLDRSAEPEPLGMC